MKRDGGSKHTGGDPPGTAARAHAKAERAQAEAEQAQADRAEAETTVAKEQAAAIAGALQKDQAHRQGDLEEVAEEEAEAMPDWPPPGH